MNALSGSGVILQWGDVLCMPESDMGMNIPESTVTSNEPTNEPTKQIKDNVSMMTIEIKKIEDEIFKRYH
jgi:hypothetical protein